MPNLEELTTPELVLHLGKTAEGSVEGDRDDLYDLEEILAELDLRSDVDAPSRRRFDRWHRGILEQLDQMPLED